MTGNEIYEQKYDEQVNNLIKNRPEQPYLRGFANFINNACTTRYVYTNTVSKFMSTVNKDPKDLTLDDYTSYLQSIKKCTSSYQISVYAALKKFSLYLKGAEINERDSMQYIKRPKFTEGIETKQKREKGYLTKHEIAKYIENVEQSIGEGKEVALRKKWKERDLAIILLLLNTGMRCAALYKLNIDSIDFDKKVLLTVDKEENIEEHFLSEEMLDILMKWIFIRDDILDDKGITNNEENALFITARGERMCEKSIARVVNKYATNIKDKNITPHKLRATYGTQIYNQTHDIYLVQKCMGHASPETSGLYIRGNKNSTREYGTQIMTDITFKKGKKNNE